MNNKRNKARLIPGKRYEFYWLDTYNFLGWKDAEEIDENTLEAEFQTTMGYYIKQVKDWYVLAMHKNPNTALGFAEWGNVCYIPKKSVSKISLL